MYRYSGIDHVTFGPPWVSDLFMSGNLKLIQQMFTTVFLNQLHVLYLIHW